MIKHEPRYWAGRDDQGKDIWVRQVSISLEGKTLEDLRQLTTEHNIPDDAEFQTNIGYVDDDEMPVATLAWLVRIPPEEIKENK